MKCRDCKWLGEVRAGVVAQTVCRRNPPTVHLLQAQGIGGVQLQQMSCWPPVDSDRDFCGEYSITQRTSI